MILSETITVQNKTETRDDEGVLIASWATFKSGVAASVQPAALTSIDATAWGVTDLAANAKKIFIYRDTSISELMRIVAWDGTYEVRGINHWPIHTEILAIPVQGI